jgi:predicted metal-dependent HD superfamily phosphohydrolase
VLKEVFLDLTLKYTADQRLADTLWYEIETSYSESQRYYHTLPHLEFLYAQLADVRDQAEDWDCLLFSMFYHDIIYLVPGTDNEDKSAEFAWDRLKQTTFPIAKISRCFKHILASKGHQKSKDHDTNLFTDADLAILGQEPDAYAKYTRQVRKEYIQYQDAAYQEGRRNVLNHFLKMDSIFKTRHFADKYEKKARENIKRELKELSK